MIILALGTNIEPREQYLKDALRKLEENNIKIISKLSFTQFILLSLLKMKIIYDIIHYLNKKKQLKLLFIKLDKYYKV